MPMARVCTSCGANIESAPLRRVCSICDKEMTDGYQVPKADALLANEGQNVGGEQLDVCKTCATTRAEDVRVAVFGNAETKLTETAIK